MFLNVIKILVKPSKLLPLYFKWEQYFPLKYMKLNSSYTWSYITSHNFKNRRGGTQFGSVFKISFQFKISNFTKFCKWTKIG